MRPRRNRSSQTAAVLTLAEIAAAFEAFNRGDSNVLDALDAIIMAVEAHQAVLRPESRREVA